MKQLGGTVTLPGSKSESNRALMIAAYGGFPLEVERLSEAHDTVLLKSLLERLHADADAVVVDCEDAGSVSRFMMTYLACRQGTWLLTGTERLCQRPMKPLIEALRQLGADIVCVGEEGCLPVRIKGKPLQGGAVAMDASMSSQHVSSLLMAAPMWNHGLKLTLEREVVSEPYIDMTVSMMRHFGASVERDGSVITIRHAPYQPARYVVEADWSAASYWYELMAIGEGGDLLLEGLRTDTLQGDVQVAGMFKAFGVETASDDLGIRLISSGSAGLPEDETLVFDFSATPDLFPAVFVTCVALHRKAVFKRITTLYMKESDRINSLISQLSKYYTFINIVSDDEIVIEKSTLKNNNHHDKILFNTFSDHRIAMALAPLKLVFGSVLFDKPKVVSKSYPDFWKQL